MRRNRGFILCAVCFVVVLMLQVVPGIAQSEGLSKVDPAKVRWAEGLLAEVHKAKSGATQFEAIDALGKKARESSAADRDVILSVAISQMMDKRRPVPDRWPCCYVIQRIGEERGVPELIQTLLQDSVDVMRAVAAEALGQLPQIEAARKAMRQAAEKDSSKMVRETLSRYLGSEMPDAKPGVLPPEPTSTGGVPELAPSGPPQPPPGPGRPVAKPLPWPFPGDSKAQNILNNYQTCTDEYIHLALDFVHPAGTPVTAVGPGYVSAIWSHEPHTHDFFVVSPVKGGSRGWCYTHMDPKTYTFKEGDFVQQGQELGKLVEFAVDGKKGMDHLHLCYVTFSKHASGRVDCHSIVDPLYFFDWKDTEAPRFLPLRFVSDGASQVFQPDAAGLVTVKGKVDILAAITDTAYAGENSLAGVPVVMLSISDGKHTTQKLVLDHRTDAGNWKQVQPMYVLRDDTRKLFNTGFNPYFQTLRVTKTDGDGIITSKDTSQCWNTAARDASGKLLWPDGKYSVNVYAWDIAGNRGVMGAVVQVKNSPGTN